MAAHDCPVVLRHRPRPRRQGGRAAPGDGGLGDQERGAARDRRRARGAPARDPRGQRARPRRRARVRALGRADGPPGARRRRAFAAIADGARAIAALPDPVGEVVDGGRLPNGLDFRKVRVPLGVIAVVYEARPNVTIDAAALCLKSGNAVLLRGSSSAAHSNAVLARIAREAAEGAGLPAGALGARGRRRARGAGRAGAAQEGIVDLIIPRGGEGLKKAISAVATRARDLRRGGQLPRLRGRDAPTSTTAERIIVNAKVQRPGVCNAAETLLVHAAVADDVPAAARWPRCASAGVELRGDERACAAIDPSVAAADGVRLGRGVPRADPRGAGRRLRRGGDRARQRVRLRPLRGDRDQRPRRPRGRSSSASTRPASTSTPRRASPTAASSGWAPRSATRPRSCTRAARSACASCAPRATWSTATGRSAA